MAKEAIHRRIEKALEAARRGGGAPVRISLRAEDMRAFERWIEARGADASAKSARPRAYLGVPISEVTIDDSSVDATFPDLPVRSHYPV